VSGWEVYQNLMIFALCGMILGHFWMHLEALRAVRKPPCLHLNRRCIHGDEIIHVGNKRAQCLNCGKFLDDLPMFCSISGLLH
jgi:hypothetical protein